MSLRRIPRTIDEQVADIYERLRRLETGYACLPNSLRQVATPVITPAPVVTGATASAVVIASEALGNGDFVNIWDSGGAKARKANASTAGKEAHGFVLAAVSSGAPAIVYFPGEENTHVSGATGGVVYLSATTAGGFSSTAPSGTGQTVQRLGVAVSATTIIFEPTAPFVIA